MMWKEPPVIKVYEALGSLGDGRVKANGNTATVLSSSGNKFYTVTFDPEANAITANDNASFFQGYLGYPMIAFLLQNGSLAHDKRWEEALRGFAWKDINVQFKNNWDKTAEYIRDKLVTRGYSLEEFDRELDNIMAQIKKLKLERLKPGAKPPAGY